ncbi:response regulator transcription factor [Pelomicrobium sp.]|uniref:response regulator transcription factor n=1 Tax=Pelomicrobium sp. TaxID=2815319 RepID=UPI002FDCA687
MERPLGDCAGMPDAGRRLRLLLVESQTLMREGLRRILSDAPDVEVAAEASSARMALRLTREREWDVVLLGLPLEDRHGLEVLKAIRAEKPKLPVLVLGAQPEDSFALCMIKAGAAGYLTKACESARLLEAIRKVARGRRYISEIMAERLALASGMNGARLPHEKLSHRELEVLCRIAGGKSRSQIAQELHLSVKTVATYRARLLEKMELKSNAELVRYAIQHGLVRT